MTTTKKISTASIIGDMQYEDINQSIAWDKRAHQVITEPKSRISKVRQLWYSYFMSTGRH